MVFRPPVGSRFPHGSTGQKANPPSSRRARVRNAAIVVGGWVALLWMFEVYDVLAWHALDSFGITPRQLGELRDIIPAAFLHFGFAHLAANSAPLLVLGFLVALSGLRQLFLIVTGIILVSGLGVWLTAPAGSTTAGASGVVFGLLGYLLIRGFVNRSIGDLALGLLVGVVYGSVLWGVLPTTSGVSWQGHLFGLAGGVAMAFLLRRRRGVPRGFGPGAPPRTPGR